MQRESGIHQNNGKQIYQGIIGLYLRIFVLFLSLFVQPSLAAGITISSNGDISTTNTNPVYALDLSAPDYAPIASGRLTVGTVNELRYNSIFIDNGIDINISAPDYTSAALIANGDIDITGNLNWLAGNLSLTSITGAINLSGSITAGSLALSAGTINLANSGKIFVPGGDTLISSGDIQLVTGADIVLSTVPLPPALWLFSAGLLGLIGVSRRNTGI